MEKREKNMERLRDERRLRKNSQTSTKAVKFSKSTAMKTGKRHSEASRR